MVRDSALRPHGHEGGEYGKPTVMPVRTPRPLRATALRTRPSAYGPGQLAPASLERKNSVDLLTTPTDRPSGVTAIANADPL
jgi:hypothetical protein